MPRVAWRVAGWAGLGAARAPWVAVRPRPVARAGCGVAAVLKANSRLGAAARARWCARLPLPRAVTGVISRGDGGRASG
eukprot:89899-Prymnesium_polylepis.1